VKEYDAGVFAFQDALGTVEIAFTDRHRVPVRGSGGGPSASLDLASRTGDGAAEAAGNLALVADAFTRGSDGSPPAARPRGPVLLRQVHGADVVVVDEELLAAPAPAAGEPPAGEPAAGEPPAGEPPVGDGLVTRLPGVVLLVRVADCVPVLLADPGAAAGGRGAVVAAVHCGRPGLVAGVVPAAVAAMRELGAEELHAWVGPHVCGACYEVPEALRAEVCDVVPQAWAETSWGTPSVDIGAGVRHQLTQAGATVTDASRCTREDEDLFSYRRQGAAAGRLGALVWVRP
jgi:YfiH family protein